MYMYTSLGFYEKRKEIGDKKWYERNSQLRGW